MNSSAFVGRSGMAGSVLVAGCFLLIGYIAIYALLAPSPKPASAPPTEFSAVRALEHSKATARVTHPMGTAADNNVRAYIIRKLIEIGRRDRQSSLRETSTGNH